MKQELITRAEFSRRAGVSGAAITTACATLLKDAVVGRRLNALHRSAVVYIAEHAKSGAPHVSGTAAAKATKKKASLDALNNGDTIHEIPEDIRDFADMTLRELIQRFGTDQAFLDWLNATKRIEDINEKRLKNAATQGELVSRALVKTGIIDPIESAHLKLLTDGAKTIARRATAMHDAGRKLGDIENFVLDQVSSFIRPMKAKIKRAFKNV